MEYPFFKAELGYWLKLLIANKNNLKRRLYKQIQKEIHEVSFKESWCCHLRKLGIKINLDNLRENQEEIDKSNYKTMHA